MRDGGLLFRLACGSGRAALARQGLVVAGVAFGSVLLLVAAGIAGLDRADVTDPGQVFGICDDKGVCRFNPVDGAVGGPITLDYLVQPGLRVGVVLGFVLCVVPLLFFVAIASRVAARRRDERLAALRLAGATQGQVRALAVLDASVGGVCGAVLGTVLYLAVRAGVLAGGEGQAAAIAERTTPPPLTGLAVLALLVAALAGGAALTLRAVQLRPLGVRRRGPRPAPRPWGLLFFLPLLAGLPLLEFAGAPVEERGTEPLVVALVATMLGLVTTAPWLTAAVGRFAAVRTGRPAVLLAARTLQHDPRPQARATGSVVLVVLAATITLATLTEFGGIPDGDDGFERGGFGAVGLGLVVSLAVGAAGLLLTTTESALERRQVLAAQHATGVPLATLRRSLLAQVALPVLPAATLAVAVGLFFGWMLYGSVALHGVALAALALPPAATLVAVAATSLTLPALRTIVDVERLRTP